VIIDASNLVVVFHALMIVILIAVLNLIFVFQNSAVGSPYLTVFSVLSLTFAFHMIVAYFTYLIKFDELAPFPCKKRYCY